MSTFVPPEPPRTFGSAPANPTTGGLFRRPIGHGMMVMAVIGLVLGEITLGVFALLSPDRQTGGFLLLAAFTGGVFFFPLIGAVVGGLINRLLPARVPFKTKIVIGSVLLLGIFAWFGWGLTFGSEEQQQSNTIQSLIASGQIANCQQVGQLEHSRWGGCIEQNMKSEADYQNCLQQTPSTYSAKDIQEVCVNALAVALKDASVCDRLEVPFTCRDRVQLGQ